MKSSKKQNAGPAEASGPSELLSQEETQEVIRGLYCDQEGHRWEVGGQCSLCGLNYQEEYERLAKEYLERIAHLRKNEERMFWDGTTSVRPSVWPYTYTSDTTNQDPNKWAAYNQTAYNRIFNTSFLSTKPKKNGEKFTLTWSEHDWKPLVEAC